jgi:hypothetical protein
MPVRDEGIVAAINEFENNSYRVTQPITRALVADLQFSKDQMLSEPGPFKLYSMRLPSSSLQ